MKHCLTLLCVLVMIEKIESNVNVLKKTYKMDLKYKHLFSFFQMIFLQRYCIIGGEDFWDFWDYQCIYLFIFKSVFFFDYILAPVHQFACSAEGKWGCNSRVNILFDIFLHQRAGWKHTQFR